MSDKLGEVMMDWEMQGDEPPSELTAMQKHLITLQCRHHVKLAEAAIEAKDKAAAEKAIALAIDAATVLSKGYGDASLLLDITALQLQIDVL